jgi:hypothetical protein
MCRIFSIAALEESAKTLPISNGVICMACISAVNSRSDETAETSWRIRWAILLALLLSSILIIAAARGDLWLDEIWSLAFARDAHSVTDIFVRFQHDNNHPLNTLFLYFLGEQKIFLTYRLFAVLSGIGSVFLIGYIAKKEWGYREALCSILLTGTSFPLLLYFSEARGYAPAIFFAMACYILLRRNSRDFTPARLVLFWAASILGILSHSTFIIAAMGFCVGNLARGFNTAGSVRQKYLRIISHHAPPLIFCAWWYMFFLKNMVIGGGPVYQIQNVVAQGSALLLGFPQIAGIEGAAMFCVLILIIAGIICLYREHDSQWLFFLIILTFSPAFLYIVSHPVIIYFRYFIICFPFFYLLFSHLICKCLRLRPNYWRLFAVAAVAMVIAGQTQRDYQLLKFGRGQYSAAIKYIANNSTGTVLVGSNHDFRIRMLFDFYAPRAAEGTRLHYVDRYQLFQELPEWIIGENISYRHPDEITVNGIWKYHFIKEYRSAEVSGWNWFLFRREAWNNRTGQNRK